MRSLKTILFSVLVLLASCESSDVVDFCSYRAGCGENDVVSTVDPDFCLIVPSETLRVTPYSKLRAKILDLNEMSLAKPIEISLHSSHAMRNPDAVAVTRLVLDLFTGGDGPIEHVARVQSSPVCAERQNIVLEPGPFLLEVFDVAARRLRYSYQTSTYIVVRMES